MFFGNTLYIIQYCTDYDMTFKFVIVPNNEHAFIRGKVEVFFLSYFPLKILIVEMIGE